MNNYNHYRRMEEKLNHIHDILHVILERFLAMEQELVRLAANISGLTDAANGAEQLLDKLAQMIRDLPSGNPADAAKITELADAVEAQRVALAASVVKNTPADTGATGATGAVNPDGTPVV